MKEYKVVKSDLHSRRNIRKLRVSIEEIPLSPFPTTTLRDLTIAACDRGPPAINVPTPLPSMDGQAVLAQAFETLLTKWHTGPSLAVTLLQHPQFKEWATLATSDRGPILFRIIEGVVPVDDQFDLMKEFLQADLVSQRNADYPYCSWHDAWDEVLGYQNWEEAKEYLREEGVISETAGHSFISAALVIVAENQLRDCRARIESPEKFTSPLSRYCEWTRSQQQCGCDGYCDCQDQPYSPQSKFLDILRDFKHTNDSVSASFWKYCLEIIDMNDKSYEKNVAIADECRHKYLQLVKHYSYVRGRTGRMVHDPGEPTDSPTPDSTTSTHTLAYERPRTNDPFDSAFHITTRDAFTTLMDKWDHLNHFNEYAHSILSLDGWGISIFEGSAAGNENLFDIIHSHAPIEKQIGIVRALLDAFANVSLTTSYSPWSVAWWQSVYAAPTWDDFVSRLDRKRITGSTPDLGRIMSPDGAKLFFDAATLLIGERLLQQLSHDMVVRKKKRCDTNVYSILYTQYMSVLREFHRKGIHVDQSWVCYLWDVM